MAGNNPHERDKAQTNGRFDPVEIQIAKLLNRFMGGAASFITLLVCWQDKDIINNNILSKPVPVFTKPTRPFVLHSQHTLPFR